MKRTIKELQAFIGVEADGVFGPKSNAALEAILNPYTLSPPETQGNTGTSRTDWRGFVHVDAGKLQAILPKPAHQLISSFLKHSDTFDLNPLFLIAISKHETGNWLSKVFKTKNNAMGISDSKGAIAMPSYDASIARMAKGLSSPTGYYKDCKTLADIAKVYAPVGATNDPGELNAFWPKSVAKFWKEFEQAIT